MSKYVADPQRVANFINQIKTFLRQFFKEECLLLVLNDVECDTPFTIMEKL